MLIFQLVVMMEDFFLAEAYFQLLLSFEKGKRNPYPEVKDYFSRIMVTHS